MHGTFRVALVDGGRKIWPNRRSNVSPELIALAVKRALAALGENNGHASGTAVKTAVTRKPEAKLDAKKDYPLAQKRPDLVRSATGLALQDITLDKVIAGQLTFDDVKIRPETLECQAQIAESAGRYHLAGNMRRAAEMTRIPDARVLEIYNALRPYRSTKQELLEIANELENKYQAHVCAAFVREAATVYEKRGRIKT